MKVSYVVTAYNTEAYIAQCIESILMQKHHEQVIVINDGSTDGTAAVIASYTNQGVTLINHTENKGCCYSRMEGMRLCTGDYMTFIDSDDYYTKQLPFPTLSRPDIIEFAMFGAFNNRATPDKILSSGEKYYADSEIWEAYRRHQIGEILVNKLISKRLYQKVAKNLNIDGLANYCDNLAIMSCYAFYAKSYKKYDEICYFYRQGTGMNTYLPKLEMFRQLCRQTEAVEILVKLGMEEETLRKEVEARAGRYLAWFDSIAECQRQENEAAQAENRPPRTITTGININDGDNQRARDIYFHTFHHTYDD